MGHQVATFVLGPVLYAQGRYVRRRIPKLPEPPGDRTGVTGTGRALRLLVAGDSAAAGVGAPSQASALTGRLVHRLQGSFRVEWRLEAQTGATTLDTISRLNSLGGSRFDVLVTSLGVNDIVRGVGARAWMRAQETLRTVARDRLGVSFMVIAGLPPVDGFPALPHPLRWYLGRRAKRFSALLEAELQHDPSAGFLDLCFTLDADLMASDGFHPGPAIYSGWADRAARMIEAERARWMSAG